MIVNAQCRTVSRLAVLAVFLAGGAASQTLGRSAAEFRGSTVISSAPVEDVAEILQSRYGVVVKYEDPVWQWPGDFRNAPGQPYGLFRIQQSVNIPPELTPDRTPALSAAAFGKVLDGYHGNYGAPHYRIAESKLGLHVIPETMRDADGKIVSAKNPFDAVVRVPADVRSAQGHLDALCAATSQLALFELGGGVGTGICGPGRRLRMGRQRREAPAMR